MKRPSRKLQVRMPADVYENLQAKARSLGFNSAPGLVRHWAVAEMRQPYKHPLELGEGSQLALKYIELLLAKYFPKDLDGDQALAYVLRHLRRREMKREDPIVWYMIKQFEKQR